VTSRRRGLPVLLAIVFAIGLLGTPPAVQEVRAALPDLTIVTSARYDVQPDERRVRVTVDMTLRNRLRDTATRRFFFDSAFLAVLPGTSGFQVSSSGRDPSVRPTRQRDDYTLLRIGLGQRLFSGRTAKYRLVFYMRDTGGASTRDVRVGTSLASFPVWAFASDDTPGSSVSVFFPKGYTVEQEAGTMPEPEVLDDGRTVFRSGNLDDPLGFFAYFVADRPGAYEEQEVQAGVGDTPVNVVVRSWPEDPDWAARIGGLFERGLPALSERIGLRWGREGGLTVEESVSRTTGGYAGLFDPTSGQVEVAYYADDFVVLHEAAHAWFNGELLVDRWALEGFASYYALEAAKDLGIEAVGDELTDALREAKIPLNAWGPIGREETATEDYAYAAALALARLIAERAGDQGLAAVWQAAASNAGAYQPPETDEEPGAGNEAPEPEPSEGSAPSDAPAGSATPATSALPTGSPAPAGTGTAAASQGPAGSGEPDGSGAPAASASPGSSTAPETSAAPVASAPPAGLGGGTGGTATVETVTGPPDWRGLLDLLEEHTDATYDDLWREWVIRPDDGALLSTRTSARERYETVVEQAGSWSLPRPIRDAMRAWRFQIATDLLDEAAGVLDQRETVAEAAADAGLTPPTTLEAAFEGDDGFEDARLEAEAQLEAIDRYVAATKSRPVDPGPLVQLGLWDADPESDLVAAAGAYSAGDLPASAALADSARQTWETAAEVGQGRALLIGAIVIALLLGLLLAAFLLLRRRSWQRRVELETATEGVAVMPIDAPAAGTLSDETATAPAVTTADPEPVAPAPDPDATQLEQVAPPPAEPPATEPPATEPPASEPPTPSDRP
jgi:hypothetical protein